MIKLEKVSKYYSGQGSVTMGLHSVSCELKENEIIAIVGESGSGKSTFLRVIGGIDTYEDGELYFNNEPTSHFITEDFEKFRRDNVGFIFQDYNLIDSYTVLQNVMLPIMLRGVDSKTAKEEAKIIIEKVGLKNRINHKSTKLSGGEKQRTVIARALASDTKILACDEPTGNLDSKTSKEIIELIKEVSKDKLVLIVTHNYDEVKEVATRRIKFHDGEIVEDVELKNTLKEEHQIKEKPAYNLKKKDLLKISFRNLLATPKKTILSLLILLSICFFITIIYQALYDSSQEATHMFNHYQNLDQERVIAFSSSDTPLDVDLIKEEFKNEIISPTTFMEETFIEIAFSNKELYADMYNNALLIYNIPKGTVLYGNLPQNKNEIVIGIDLRHIYRNYDILESQIIINKQIFNISGYFFINFPVSSNLVIYANDSALPTIYEKFALNYHLSAELSNGYGYTSQIIVSNSFANSNKIYVTYKTNEENLARKIMESKKIYLTPMYGSKRVEITHYELEFIENNQNETGTLFISNELVKINLLFDNTRSVSIYSSNTANVIKRLNALNIRNHKPAEVGISLDKLITQIQFVLVAIISSIAVLLIIGFTYFLLSKVYITKNKDYTIMRTLGINKYMMSKIVKYEILSLTIVSSIIVAIIIIIGYKYTDYGLFKLFESFDIVPFVVIFIFIALLSLRIAKMFNKRLFKFSVNSSLRMEELSND